MAQTTITLTQGPMNVSLQRGDVIYYCQTIGGQSGKNHPTATINTQPLELGTVIAINRNALTITVECGGNCPDFSGSYLFFIKDGVSNHSGIIGAWLNTEYRNYSSLSSEIFATATDFVESSR